MTWNEAIADLWNHVVAGYSTMYPGDSFQTKAYFCDEGYSAVKSDISCGSLDNEFGHNTWSLWESDQVSIHPRCQDLAYTLFYKAIFAVCKAFPMEGAVNDINQWPLESPDFQNRVAAKIKQLYDE